jgi:hypothetical protein
MEVLKSCFDNECSGGGKLCSHTPVSFWNGENRERRPKTWQSPHTVSTSPARMTSAAVSLLISTTCRGRGLANVLPNGMWNAYHALTAIGDTTGRGVMKRLSLSILLILAAFAFGRLRMAAQDVSPQTHGPEAPARHELDKDQQLALMRQDIQSVRKRLIADNLDLTVTEAAKFWPMYEEYSTDFGKIDENRSVIVKEYSESFGSVTDEQADNLIRRWLDTDISAAQLRQKYVPIIRTVLPGKKAATFFQLDRRISMMIDVQIMSQIPLVQSQVPVLAKTDDQ